MADDSYLGHVLGWLKGSPTASTVNPAPPMASYPTNDDAAYAQKYGFGYGTGNEPFLNNERTRVMGQEVPFYDINKKGKPVKSAPIFMPQGSADAISGVPGEDGISKLMTVANDPTKSSVIDNQANPDLKGSLNNVMMRAALAANRSPIASLGFDPNSSVIDAVSPHHSLTVGGVYDPSKGPNIYANLTTENPSSIVHESTHRGIQKLREQYPNELMKAFDTLPNEETVVRWLMHKNSGDPEGGDGPIDKKQRQEGINAFEHSNFGASRNAALSQLEELAAQAIKNRNPRGPH